MAKAIQKKISMATFWSGKVKELVEAKADQIELCTIIGQVTGTKVGTSQYGDYEALMGLFEAVDSRTGEAVRSTKLFVPEILMGYVKPASEGDVVKFAVKIYAQLDDKSSVGFSYTFEPLIEAQDPLLEMRQLVFAGSSQQETKAVTDKRASKKKAA